MQYLESLRMDVNFVFAWMRRADNYVPKMAKDFQELTAWWGDWFDIGKSIDF